MSRHCFPHLYLSLFESHGGYTAWRSTTTLSSSAAVTTALSTPHTLPKQGRRSSFSNAATSLAAPPSPKKLSPAFFFPNALTLSRSSALKSSVNSTSPATASRFFRLTAHFPPCPAATTSGA